MNKVRILKSSFLYSSIYSETSKAKLKRNNKNSRLQIVCSLLFIIKQKFI